MKDFSNQDLVELIKNSSYIRREDLHTNPHEYNSMDNNRTSAARRLLRQSTNTVDMLHITNHCSDDLVYTAIKTIIKNSPDDIDIIIMLIGDLLGKEHIGLEKEAWKNFLKSNPSDEKWLFLAQN